MLGRYCLDKEEQNHHRTHIQKKKTNNTHTQKNPHKKTQPTNQKKQANKKNHQKTPNALPLLAIWKLSWALTFWSH